MARQKYADKQLITKVDSAAWGLITLIPLGWIILWANINARRSEVEKGIRSKESAIESINNYISCVVAITVLVFIIALFRFTASSGQSVIIPNVVALVVLIVSSIHNKARINKVDKTHTEDSDGDAESENLFDYFSNANELKKRLESIDRESECYELDIVSIRYDINKFFNEYKNAEFPDGGKYKIYELRAEYYFVVNNKALAKKYIEKSIEIRKQEQLRNNIEDTYNDEVYAEI